MLFMTSGYGSPRHKAMLAHQNMFGKFVDAKRVADIGLWQTWGADNGAFTGFDQDRFMKNFRILLPFQSACKFVVVPDVPFCWEPTLEKFKDWSPTVRRLGFPLALAVQDGATVENVPWCEFDALFVGGSTEWKRQQWRQTDNDLPLFTGKPYSMERPTVVADLITEAKIRGKWVHIGRSANTPAQLWYAYRLGADSVDGTGEKYQPDVKFKWIAQTMWEIHRDIATRCQHNTRHNSTQPEHGRTSNVSLDQFSL